MTGPPQDNKPKGRQKLSMTIFTHIDGDTQPMFTNSVAGEHHTKMLNEISAVDDPVLAYMALLETTESAVRESCSHAGYEHPDSDNHTNAQLAVYPDGSALAVIALDRKDRQVHIKMAPMTKERGRRWILEMVEKHGLTHAKGENLQPENDPAELVKATTRRQETEAAKSATPAPDMSGNETEMRDAVIAAVTTLSKRVADPGRNGNEAGQAAKLLKSLAHWETLLREREDMSTVREHLKEYGERHPDELESRTGNSPDPERPETSENASG